MRLDGYGLTAEGFSGHDKPRQQAQTGQTRPINACSFWLEGGLLHCTPVSAFGQSVCQVASTKVYSSCPQPERSPGAACSKQGR